MIAFYATQFQVDEGPCLGSVVIEVKCQLWPKASGDSTGPDVQGGWLSMPVAGWGGDGGVPPPEGLLVASCSMVAGTLSEVGVLRQKVVFRQLQASFRTGIGVPSILWLKAITGLTPI